MPGRTDFRVADGDRLLLFLGSSRVLAAGWGVLGRSSLRGFSDGLGAVHANLIVHARFGVSFVGVTGAEGCASVGRVTGSLVPTQAKVIQRFLGTTAAGTDFGDTLVSTVRASLFCSIGGPADVGGGIDFFDSEKGAKLVNVMLGGGGLGVLVRDGLVKPSLVSSAVDATLPLLAMDRRRDKSVVT